MKKILMFLCTFLMLFGMIGTANALTFTGSTYGEWSNVVSTDPEDVYSINNDDTSGFATFNWGIPATTDFDNQFTFDGAGWTIDGESVFKVGDFIYRNGSTWNSSGIDGVSLDISLYIASPMINTSGFNFDFSIINTPNITGNNVTDGDIVTTINPFSDTTFMYNGIDYTLELIGFSSDLGVTIQNDFSSPERTTASAGIYARITSEIPNPVPEPATIFLMGLGLFSIVGIRRRKKS